MRKELGVAFGLAVAGLGAYAVLSSDPPADFAASPGGGAPPIAAPTSRLSFAGPMLFQASASDELNEPGRAASPPKVRAQAAPPPRVVMAEGAVRRPVGEQAGATAPLSPAALTREVQRELRRVGCFHGPVTGAWTASTRAAMKDFTGRMNASLPVDEPDQVLLALLRSHADNACNQACAAGHARAPDGRCAPIAVVDRAYPPGEVRRKTTDRTELAAPVPPSDTSPVLPGRMALAGPRAEESSAAAQRATERRSVSHPTPSNNSRRRAMGAWLFHDAPVDRVLGRPGW